MVVAILRWWWLEDEDDFKPRALVNGFLGYKECRLDLLAYVGMASRGPIPSFSSAAPFYSPMWVQLYKRQKVFWVYLGGKASLLSMARLAPVRCQSGTRQIVLDSFL